MKALHGGRTQEFQTDYHLGRNDAPEFDQGQPQRIQIARDYIRHILFTDRARPFRIVELGCGSGDVSGPFAQGVNLKGLDTAGVEVIGIDFVPVAKEKCNLRWPGMDFRLAAVEDVEPIECDLLVMTEFLEHLAEPLQVADAWMAKARWALVGHPLDEPEPYVEFGHSWSYSLSDFDAWFSRVSFNVDDLKIFSMGPFPKMIIGYGHKP
jgi:SAM-dependent methyltransferase